MRGSTLNRLAWLALAVLLAVGCKSRRERGAVPIVGERLVSRAESAEIRRGMEGARLDYTTFNGRAKSTLRLNRDVHDVTAHVRIRKDEAIWISVTALLGMEVARVMITPERIQIVNRLQSVYIDQPFGYIRRFASEELDFGAVQDLLTGEVLGSFIDRHARLSAFDKGYVFRGIREDLAYELTLDTAYRASFTALDDTATGQRLTSMYEKRDTAGRTFPEVFQLSLQADRLDLQIDMAYTRVAFDEVVDMPFSIPARFDEVL